MKHSIGRRALAVVAGVVAAGVAIGLMEAAAHSAMDGEALFGAVCVAQGLAAALGGGIAAKWGGSAVLGWIVAAILLALSLGNVFSFPHPGWFVPLVTLAVGAGAQVGIVAAARMGKPSGR